MDVTLNKIDRILSYPCNMYQKYFWCRRKVEYIIRLMYAITVDMALQNGKEVHEALKKVKQGTLGAYCASANNLIAKLPEEQRVIFRNVWGKLREIKEMRNEDAHEGTPANELEQFIVNNIQGLKDIIEYTHDMYFNFDRNSNIKHLYLVVPNDVDESETCDEIHCYRILPEEYCYETIISRKKLMRGNDKLAGQLYLYVQSIDTIRYYRISPFIGWDTNNGEPNSTMFMGAVQFWKDEVTIEHMGILNNKNNRSLPYLSCELKSLIPDINNDSKFCSVNGNKKNVDINMSKYPEYDIIVTERLPYCKQICPKFEDVVNYCKQRRGTYRIICGEGGMGKTALVLNLIHDVILRGESDFTRVIFLSAKKYFRYTSYTRPEDELEGEITPDIDNYEDFLEHLAFYLFDEQEEYSKDNLEEELLSKINGKSKNKKRVSIPITFLVVDDLDTFLPEDQNSVIDFLEKVNSNKLNALITTRNMRINEHKEIINPLEKQQTMDFLKWCIEKDCPGEGRRLCDTQNPDVVYHLTEGRPLGIKLWNNLLVRGLDVPNRFETYWTKKQKTLYLYQTTLRQLNEKEQEMYHLVCVIYDIFKLDREETERIMIPVQLIYYLYPEKGKEEIIEELENLCDVNLLLLERGNIFVEEIDYFELIQKAGLCSLPDKMTLLLEDMRNATNIWKSSHFVRRLIQCLAGKMGSGNRNYMYSILNRLEEDRDNLGPTEIEWVNKLNLQYQQDVVLTETNEQNDLDISEEIKEESDLDISEGMNEESNLDDVLDDRNEENDLDDVKEDIQQLTEQILRIKECAINKTINERELCIDIKKIYDEITRINIIINQADTFVQNQFNKMKQTFIHSGLTDFL